MDASLPGLWFAALRHRGRSVHNEELVRAVEGRLHWRMEGERVAVFQPLGAAGHVKVRLVAQPVKASVRYVVWTIEGGRATVRHRGRGHPARRADTTPLNDPLSGACFVLHFDRQSVTRQRIQEAARDEL